MKSSQIKHFLIILLSTTLIYSCSTVKVIPNGSYRLKENSIKVLNSKTIQKSDLELYIKQKPNSYFILGWNPFVNIYNWSTGKGNAWDRFVKKIGQTPVVFDSTSVESSNENIENHLKSLGYYDSKVTDTVVYNRRKASVKYFVTVGNRYEISDIRYIIADTTIKKLVIKDTLNSLIKKGSFLSEKLLMLESERVSTLLRNIGYYSFSKNFLFFEADTNKGDGLAQLNFKIENFTRNESSKDKRDHKIFKVRNVKIYSDYNPAKPLNDLEMSLDTIKYKDLIILSEKKLEIRPSVFYLINRIKKDNLYNESQVNNTYNRLNDLRYYSGINIQFDEVQNDKDSKTGLVDCSIRLTPSKSQGYKLNLEGSRGSNGLLGISPAISYYHKNIFNGGEWLSLGFMGNFQFKMNDPIRSTELGISGGVSVPNFLLLPDRIFKSSVPRTDINLIYNYHNRPEFKRNLISMSYGYNWKSGERYFYRINPVQLSVVRIFNMSTSFYESLKDPFLKNSYKNYFDLGAGATITYTTDASPNPKRTFFYYRWINDISGSLLSAFNNSMPIDSTSARTIWGTAYSQYVKSDFTMVYTLKFENKTALATRFVFGVGAAYGNSKSLPFEKLFYSGGANSLRGWQARSVGPGSSQIDTTFTIPNQTGDIKLEFNTEFRFPVFWKVEGAVFVDAGNVWTIRSEEKREQGQFKFNTFYKNIALNWGLGTRLNLDFVILRLDLGIIAYEPSQKRWIGISKFLSKNTFSFQFGVGYPF